MMTTSKVSEVSSRYRRRVEVLQLGARVLERALMPLRQELATASHHLFVDVHHERALDGSMAQHLAKRGPLSAADNEDAPRLRMGQHRRVNQHSW